MWLFFALASPAIFAVVNILDSILVHKYEKNPVIIMWFFGILRVVIISSFPFFFDISTSHWWVLVGLGAVMSLGLMLYLRILENVDTSVTQSSWAIESIILSIFGFAFLSESWTLMQTIGAVLILTSVFILSYAHHHASVIRTLARFSALAFVVAIAEFGVKYILTLGVPYVTVLFWYVLGTGLTSIVLPIFSTDFWNRIRTILRTAPRAFYACLILDMSLAFLGFACLVKAFEIGMLSLVTIAGNLHPFFVIFFAWTLMQTKATHVPKELLSVQSITIKLLCFTIVLVGLTLLILNGIAP